MRVHWAWVILTGVVVYYVTMRWHTMADAISPNAVSSGTGVPNTLPAGTGSPGPSTANTLPPVPTKPPGPAAQFYNLTHPIRKL